MTNQQPEALRLAAWFESCYQEASIPVQAAAELRRLHAENLQLSAALEQPQPPRQPLTDEQIFAAEASIWQLDSMDEVEREANTLFARAIERAHGIGGEA